jgi:hypothetical protein
MRSLTRTVLFPVLILAIAAALTWDARHGATTPAPPGAVEEFVRAGVDDASYGATDPLLVKLLRDAWPRDATEFNVTPVEGGDAPDGATHRVAIVSNGQVRLMLRVHYDADPAQRRFVGFSRQ